MNLKKIFWRKDTKELLILYLHIVFWWMIFWIATGDMNRSFGASFVLHIVHPLLPKEAKEDEI